MFGAGGSVSKGFASLRSLYTCQTYGLRVDGKVGDLNLDTIKWGDYGLVVISGKENEDGENGLR